MQAHVARNALHIIAFARKCAAHVALCTALSSQNKTRGAMITMNLVGLIFKVAASVVLLIGFLDIACVMPASVMHLSQKSK